MILTGSGLLAATKYLREQSGKFPRVSRDYKITSMNYTSVVTRDVDITFCKVWGKEPDLFDIFFTLAVIILPLMMGPVITAFLELFQFIKQYSVKRERNLAVFPSTLWEPCWCNDLLDRTKQYDYRTLYAPACGILLLQT